MTTLREAAQQALETLEDIFGKNKVDIGAITALRAALAQEEQPEQEPVAWMRPNETLCVVREVAEAEGYQPLYTHPPRREWKGLSKDEALKLWGMRSDGPSNTEITSFASAIEQALKERNHD